MKAFLFMLGVVAFPCLIAAIIIQKDRLDQLELKVQQVRDYDLERIRYQHGELRAILLDSLAAFSGTPQTNITFFDKNPDKRPR